MIQSIGGGIAGEELGEDLSINDLMESDVWEKHFELSGCSWAIKKVRENGRNYDIVIDALVAEACKRNGISENE